MTPDPKDSLNEYQLVGPSEDGKINNLLAELKARESAQRLAWVRLYFAIFASSGNAAASIANWRAIRFAYFHIAIGTLPCRSGKGPRAHEMWLPTLSVLLLCRA